MMALLCSPHRERESGGPSNYYEQSDIHPTVLFPPSYFKTVVAAPSAEGEESTSSAGSPAGTYVVSREESPRLGQHRVTCEKERKEVAVLRRQNEALRSQLQAMRQMASTGGVLPSCISHCTPAFLTSDLLQVERGLQSQLAHSEEEVHRLMEQLAVVEATLREERASHSSERENLIAQHQLELEQVASDRSEGEERWRRECEECRERAGRAEEREKEREEELNQAQENLALATQERDDVCGEMEKERSAHREEVASLQLQLNTTSDNLTTLQGQLDAAQHRVGCLESYLGGELPEEGVTWREERAALLDRITGCAEDREKAEKETQLMAVRLTAISEILTLQETALMQGKGEAGGEVTLENGGSGAGAVSPPEGRRDEGLKSVLALWREKVFSLLVQARLTDMQRKRELQETQSRVCGLEVELGDAEREKDLATHTLTDRTAQLQLLTTRTEELERCVQSAEEGRAASQAAVESLSSQLQLGLSGWRERWGRLKACLDRCLSRLASYQQRVGVTSGRVAALTALLGSQMELGGVQIARDCPLSRDDVIVGKCDVTTQTELLETSEDLSNLPQEVLVDEVVSLVRERDTLTHQLSQSTVSLQQLRASASERQEALERRCSTLSVDSQSLREQVESLTAELEGHKETEAQLHATQASLQARIDEAVMEERRSGRHQLSEVQSLLEVARREQAKTALHLQRTERKLEQERSSAVEAVEVARCGLEEELKRCRDRLRAVQVERNLLLTTLRQEGIKVPPKRPPPKQQQPQIISPEHPRAGPPHTATQLTTQDSVVHTTSSSGTEEGATMRTTHLLIESGCGVERSRSSSPSPPTDTAHRDAGSERECGGDCEISVVSETQETVEINMMRGASPHSPLNDRHVNCEEDIQHVLKELQSLSTALLDMK